MNLPAPQSSLPGKKVAGERRRVFPQSVSPSSELVTQATLSGSELIAEF
tara:strand:- start:39 stop:185 length:147 start_codon:yes stop_codon:yes gene_type:complete